MTKLILISLILFGCGVGDKENYKASLEKKGYPETKKEVDSIPHIILDTMYIVGEIKK